MQTRPFTARLTMVTDCRYLSSSLCCTPQTYLDQDAFFKSITWDLCSKEPTLGNVPLLGERWGLGVGGRVTLLSLSSCPQWCHGSVSWTTERGATKKPQLGSSCQLLLLKKKKKKYKEKEKTHSSKIRRKKKNPALEMLKRKTKSLPLLTKEKQCFV